MSRYSRPAVWVAVLFVIGIVLAWHQTAHPELRQQREVGTATKFPRQVQIIRHAEKPADDTDIHLTSRGAARAAALPSLFLIPPRFKTTPAAFERPDFLFAAKESKRSNRSVETVTPLSKALGDLDIHHKHSNEEFAKVVDTIFNDDRFVNKTILICWHHGKSAALALAIAARAKNAARLKGQVPDTWKSPVFDRVWLFTFDDNGNATFTDRPQRLLFGDSAN